MGTTSRRFFVAALIGLTSLFFGGRAQAVTVLCWGGGIPCFHVSNCGGYPACTGGNQPCCLGGTAAFGGAVSYSDRLQPATGAQVVESLQITSELQGTVVVDLFSGGKLVAENVARISLANVPLQIDLSTKGVTADYFRVYIEQSEAKESLPGGQVRDAVLAPTVYHTITGKSKGVAPDGQVNAASATTTKSIRLLPDLAVDQEGTALQCK